LRVCGEWLTVWSAAFRGRRGCGEKSRRRGPCPTKISPGARNISRAQAAERRYLFPASGFTPTQFNQLARYSDGTKTVSFTYDRSGNRLTRAAAGSAKTSNPKHNNF
jgi:YD repeat-containing protein